jgi:hypothetical protein
MKICRKELNESFAWMKVIVKSKLLSWERVKPDYNECNELIFVSSLASPSELTESTPDVVQDWKQRLPFSPQALKSWKPVCSQNIKFSQKREKIRNSSFVTRNSDRKKTIGEQHSDY